MSTHSTTSISIGSAIARMTHMILPQGGAIMFRGAPGAGKTSQILCEMRRLQAERADFGACAFNAGNAQSVDIFGWPKIQPGPLSMNGVPVLLQPVAHEGLRGAYPILCPDELRHPACPHAPIGKDNLFAVDAQGNPQLTTGMLVPYSTGILLFDEAGKVADESVMSSLAQLANEGRAGQWGVPVDGWARVFVTNGVQHGSNDLEFPAHTLNRLAVYDVHTTIDDVLPYWRSIGMHEFFLQFAQCETASVLATEVPLDKSQFGTARSFTLAWKDCMNYAQHILQMDNINPPAKPGEKPLPFDPGFLPVFGPDETDGDLAEASRGFIATIAARCGEALALKFHDFVLHMNERPTVEEIVSDPHEARMPDHMGVLKATVDMITTNVKLDQVNPVCTYVKRMPRPMMPIFVAAMGRKHGPALARSKSFQELIQLSGQSSRVALYT